MRQWMWMRRRRLRRLPLWRQRVRRKVDLRRPEKCFGHLVVRAALDAEGRAEHHLIEAREHRLQRALRQACELVHVDVHLHVVSAPAQKYGTTHYGCSARDKPETRVDHSEHASQTHLDSSGLHPYQRNGSKHPNDHHMYLMSVPVLRISTGLLLYAVMNEGSPNCSMSSQRRMILKRPTQGLGPAGEAGVDLNAVPLLVRLLAALGVGEKNSGASMQY